MNFTVAYNCMKLDGQITVKQMEIIQKYNCLYSTQKPKWKQLKRDEKRNFRDVSPKLLTSRALLLRNIGITLPISFSSRFYSSKISHYWLLKKTKKQDKAVAFNLMLRNGGRY